MTPIGDAALHTHKGHNYKAWNEDGGALFADARERLYLGAFDQAGGEGIDSQARGAASAISAQSLFDEMQGVAQRAGAESDAEESLVRAAQKGHDAIIARQKREVTTYVGAMIDRGVAIVVNVGDSGAMHFSPTGEHIESTVPQGIGRLLLEGLGIDREQPFNHESYRWTLAPGDLLVFGTDGFFDSNLTEEEIGSIVASSDDAGEATACLRTIVSVRMKTMEGKPDNLTVLVVRML